LLDATYVVYFEVGVARHQPACAQKRTTRAFQLKEFCAFAGTGLTVDFHYSGLTASVARIKNPPRGRVSGVSARSLVAVF
jgi:hypothetical protein